MTTRPFDQILGVSDLKTTADRLGNFFFTPGAMRFFNSRVDWKLFRVDDSRGYFVTSEKYDGYNSTYSERRKWTVRQYAVVRDHDGRDRLEIDSVGTFQGFASLEGARTHAEALQGFALIDPKAF